MEKALTAVAEFIEELPEEGKEMDILFELGNLKSFINNPKVYQLMEDTINEEMRKYPYIKLSKI